MKALLVYPEVPNTFWSFRYALPFIAKRAVHPPLGLLTVGAMMPHTWEKRLVDMNVTPLRDRDLAWADTVFISAMMVQRDAARRVIDRAGQTGVQVVAGGPLFTAEPEAFEDVDHLVLNEAEITFPRFLSDLGQGAPRHLYTTSAFPDIARTPIPLWSLLTMRKYVSMSLQYSRGCPFQCEFCDITVLYGRKVRTKSRDQVLEELEALYRSGWRGGVFFVDDNFIGNRAALKRDVLPAMIRWMERRHYPFSFSTEASVDLADDDDLMTRMVRAGFEGVFVGIETPEEESLKECRKNQNRNRDLIASVQRMHRKGLRVRGGFIVGFDHDSSSVFERQVRFIQKTRIVTAMVGLLNAPRGTPLYRRILREGRLLPNMTGDNTDASTNIVPKMGYDALHRGYRQVLQGIYAARPYSERVRDFLREYRPEVRRPVHLHSGHIRFHAGYAGAAFKSLVQLGIRDSERKYYWKLLLWTLFRRPFLLPMAMAYAIYGYHFRKVFAGLL